MRATCLTYLEERIQITNLLIMQFSAASFYFIPGPNILLPWSQLL
jgi:hypothetical protein